MAKLFSALISDTLLAIGQVNGIGAQIYSEDTIANALQRTFNLVFSELWWPDYMTWYTRTLDGTVGIPTADITTVDSFNDIRAVFQGTSNRPLDQTPRNINPNLMTGTTPVYVEAYRDTDDKVFRVWPATSTGTVYIHARDKPTDFTLNDSVLMDEDLLVAGAAYDQLEDDGANPGATEKFQSVFRDRLLQLKQMYSRMPIRLDPRAGSVPTEWYETR